MVLALHLLAIAGYLAAWAAQVRGFRIRDARPSSAAVLLTATGATAHLLGLIAFVLAHQTLPLVGLGPASSTLALSISAVFLAAAVLRPDTRSAGLLVLPFILLLLAEAAIVGIEPVQPQTAFRGPWFVFHVATVFAGYAGLLLASVAGVMYLFQFRALKRKDFGSVFRFFPSLDTLDRLNRVGLGVGFPSLTMGLIAGWGFTLTYGRGLALGDAEVIFGVVTWVVFLLAILVRVLPPARAVSTALATALAFGVTVGTFLVLRLASGPTGFFL